MNEKLKKIRAFKKSIPAGADPDLTSAMLNMAIEVIDELEEKIEQMGDGGFYDN